MNFIGHCQQNMAERAVTRPSGDSIGECGRLSQPSWLLGAL